LVGIVSGHKGYDPGAVCPDGLTEVQINHAIAVEVVSLLRRKHIRADLLDEYDERLTDYQAEALVSIHSDSCNISGASGYKIARVTDSVIPEAEDLLVTSRGNHRNRFSTGRSPDPTAETQDCGQGHCRRHHLLSRDCSGRACRITNFWKFPIRKPRIDGIGLTGISSIRFS
jgi:N-acetylmuramoyl-L-alanine amidase